jgi:hypothetical protein
MRLSILILFSGLLIISACSPVYTYFTHDLYQQENWTAEDIQRVQFYTSRDIVLFRQISAGETAITGGKIVVQEGQRFEKVIIRQGTPGVLVMMPKEDRFAISFDENELDAYLMFGPNPKMGGRYALLAQEWNQDLGTVHYKDRVYSVDAQYAFASLMVDLRKTGQNEYETKTVKGRTVAN